MPLAISLRDRARAEKKTEVLTSALTIAASLDSETLRAGPALDRKIAALRRQVDGAGDRPRRATASSLADSDGKAVGDNFLTPLRPGDPRPALQSRQPRAPPREIRYSDTEQARHHGRRRARGRPADSIGAVRITRNDPGGERRRPRTHDRLGLGRSAGPAWSSALVIAFGVSGSLARPLTRLAAAAHRLGSGDLSARADDVTGADGDRGAGRLVRRDGRPRGAHRAGATRVRRERVAPAPDAAHRDEAPARVARSNGRTPRDDARPRRPPTRRSTGWRRPSIGCW